MEAGDVVMTHISSKVGIFVLAHPSKQCTTSDLLRRMGVSHNVYVNRDWVLPKSHAEWETDRSWRPIQRDYAIRQYRAIRGHQEIHRQASDELDYILVMEDDITDMPPEFIHYAAGVMTMLFHSPTTLYSAVSFHGRNLSSHESIGDVLGREYGTLFPRTVHEKAQQEFLKPLWDTTSTVQLPLTLKWHEGCLMYGVNREGRDIWRNADLSTGWPCDLFMVNNLNTAVLLDSPVVHGNVSLMRESVV